MATRMQQRRGTAAQWISTNDGDGPILQAGEIGFESDTGKFKIGDGVNPWVDLDYFLDESDIEGIGGDYVFANTLGQANGVATLDGSGKLTSSQVPNTLATTSYVDTAVSNLANSAPELLDTLNELAAAINDDPTFFTTVANNLTNHESDTTNIHGITDTAELSTKEFAANLLVNATKSNITITGDKTGLTITAENGVADSTTSDLAEGTNLYFTNARAQAAVAADITTAIDALSTTDIEEGTNQYFTNARVEAVIAASDTADLAEGTNLYYTNARVEAVIAASDTGDLAEGTNLYFTNARARAVVDGGTGLDYNSSTGVFDIDSTVTTNTGSQTLTNKSVDLANNTVTGTVAQFNSALSDANFITTTDTGTVTSAMLTDETIVNADIANNAAIAQSKIDGLTTDLSAKAALAGAAFTGNVSTTGSLTVDGNFTVNGSNVLVSATQIQIEDSILQLAHENSANTVDLGLVAGYNDGTAKHAGLVKDATDGKWKLFDGVTDEPTTTVNFAQATLDDLVVGGLEASSLTVGDVSNTEFGYLANVTSDIQTQLNSKASSTDLSNHESDTTNIHGIANTAAIVFTTDTGTVTSTMLADETIVNADISNTAAIALSKLATDPLARANHTGTQTASTISDFDEAAQDAVGAILGSGLTYTDASNTITVDSTVVQLRVSGVTDTELGYLDGVTSNVQAQIDGKISSSSSDTLTNKSINLANNTVSGTIAEFNTALSDADFATLAGTETLNNKTANALTLTGTLTANSVAGTNGQYLQTTGTGVQWATVSEPTLHTVFAMI
jgi:hypothetical protein